MKKIMLALVLFVLAFAVTIPVGASQPAYPDELLYIDAQLTVFLPRLDAFEAQYYAQQATYWQALSSHNTPPEGVAPPTDMNAIPTDGTLSLAVMWDYAALPEAIGWSWRVDTYAGPDGDGYVLTVDATVGADVWRKSINTGPDTWRASDWYLVVPIEF